MTVQQINSELSNFEDCALNDKLMRCDSWRHVAEVANATIQRQLERKINPKKDQQCLTAKDRLEKILIILKK